MSDPRKDAEAPSPDPRNDFEARWLEEASMGERDLSDPDLRSLPPATRAKLERLFQLHQSLEADGALERSLLNEIESMDESGESGGSLWVAKKVGDLPFPPPSREKRPRSKAWGLLAIAAGLLLMTWATIRLVPSKDQGLRFEEGTTLDSGASHAPPILIAPRDMRGVRGEFTWQGPLAAGCRFRVKVFDPEDPAMVIATSPPVASATWVADSELPDRFTWTVEVLEGDNVLSASERAMVFVDDQAPPRLPPSKKASSK